MPTHVRLVHKVLEGRYHVYTSPDLKGLHITADTQAGAQKAAVAMVHAIADRLQEAAPTVDFVEFARAA